MRFPAEKQGLIVVYEVQKSTYLIERNARKPLAVWIAQKVKS
jgi:hypothetical protein